MCILAARRHLHMGAGLAASTLVFPGQEEPPLWQILGRIFHALGEIVLNWPEGVPINGLSVLLQLMKVADLLDVGAKIEDFMRKVTAVPPLENTIWGAIITAALIPMWVLFLVNFVGYWNSYASYTGSSFTALDEVESGVAPIVSPRVWFFLRFLPMFIVGNFFLTFSQWMVNGTWYMINSMIQVFYTGSGTTMSGVFTELLSRMAEGLGMVEFILAFCILWIGGAVVVIHYLKRFLSFIRANVVFLWEGTYSLRGLPGVTLAEPARKYLESLTELAIMVFILLVGPLLIHTITVLQGLPAVAALVVIMWAAVKIPAGIMVQYPQFAERFRSWYRGFETAETAVMGDERTPPNPNRSYVVRTSGKAVNTILKAASTPTEGNRDAFVSARVKRMMEEKRSNTSQTTARKAGIPQELKARMNDLDTDPELNDALFGWMVDTYRHAKPMKPFETLLDSAKKEISQMLNDNPDAFNKLVSRGKRLKTNFGEEFHEA